MIPIYYIVNGKLNKGAIMNAKDFLLEENPEKEPMPFGAVVNIMEAYSSHTEQEYAQRYEEMIQDKDRQIGRLKKLIYEYGEWARGNGERFRGNLQKNNEALFNQFIKEKDGKA